MKNIYDYQNNIKVTTTPNGDKVITMNEEILTSIRNHLFEVADKYEAEGFKALAKDTMELWRALIK